MINTNDTAKVEAMSISDAFLSGTNIRMLIPAKFDPYPGKKLGWKKKSRGLAGTAEIVSLGEVEGEGRWCVIRKVS
jgi:hypothetical protein